MIKLKQNQKVKIITGEVGNIHKVYPPCEEHSGRIIVYIPTKHRPMFKEFWFSDLGETLFLVDKEKEEEIRE